MEGNIYRKPDNKKSNTSHRKTTIDRKTDKGTGKEAFRQQGRKKEGRKDRRETGGKETDKRQQDKERR